MLDSFPQRPPSPSLSAATSASNQREGVSNRGPGSPTVNLMNSGGGSSTDNIRVCARFRPLNKVEESINAHLAVSGVKDAAFNCVRFPSEMRDRVEIKVPDALLNAVERHEQSGRGDEGFISDITNTFGGNSRSEASSARSPSLSSSAVNPLSTSPSNLSTFSAASPSNAFNSASSYAFTFDHVFDQQVSQESVYLEVGAPVVEDVMLGYNGTIFVYGQTGSGKTFTMMGAPLPNAPVGERARQGSVVSNTASTPRRSGNTSGAGPFSPGGYQNPRNQPYSSSQALQVPPAFDLFSPDGAGIIPRAVNHLFECMYSSPDTVSYTVSLFFVEIYMEKVRDLLVPDPSLSNLSIREDPKSSSFYIEGCVMADVTSPEEIFQLLNYGIQNRATASTKMNVMSSRSHCLLCIAVHAFDSELGEQRIGKLFMVDLAGSEKVAKTRAEGQQLEEAKVINKSLTALGHVINQLSNRAPHVPYRDSKLTKILQDALGGNSKTALIVCCSPSVRNIHETLSTLRFGQRAKTVKNRAVINKQFTIEELKVMLAAAKVEIDSLRKIGTNNNAPQSGIGISNHAVIEARFAEEKKALIANIHSMEDALRDAHDAADTEAEERTRLERTLSHLREEIRLWESEYATKVSELEQANSAQADLKKQLVNEKEAMSVLLQQAAARKSDVARLRELAQKAVEQMQAEGQDLHTTNIALEQQVAVLKRTNKKLSERNTTLLQEAKRREEEIEKERQEASQRPQYIQQLHTPSASSSPHLIPEHATDARALSVATSGHSSPLLGTINLQGDDFTFDRSNSLATQLMTNGLRQQLAAARASAASATEKLVAAERERDDFETSLISLRHENELLNSKLQELSKKLSIRTERCENFSSAFKIQNESFDALQISAKKEKDALKVQVLQARSDAAYWRLKATQQQNYAASAVDKTSSSSLSGRQVSNATDTLKANKTKALSPTSLQQVADLHRNESSLIDFATDQNRVAANRVINRNLAVDRRASGELGGISSSSAFVNSATMSPSSHSYSHTSNSFKVHNKTTSHTYSAQQTLPPYDIDAAGKDHGEVASPLSVKSPKSPSPFHNATTTTRVSVPVIRGGGGGSGKISPSAGSPGSTLPRPISPTNSPSPDMPDRPVGLVNVNLTSYLSGGASAHDLTSPLLASSTIRVGAGGFGAPPYYHLAPTGDGGVVVVGDSAMGQSSGIFMGGSIKGRQPSAGTAPSKEGGHQSARAHTIEEFMHDDDGDEAQGDATDDKS